MDIWIIGTLWFLTMWRLWSAHEDVRAIRARLDKGAPLSAAEEEAAATSHVYEPPQGLPKNA